MDQRTLLRHPAQVFHWAKELRRVTHHPWTIMEVCGGQTHALLRYGLDGLLPSTLRLIHGPGCPVCVTSEHGINMAIAIARHPHVILCIWGDMLRVPGSSLSLAAARALGADIRVITSPLQAVSLAQQYPKREIVFFAVGFETTSPGTALALHDAEERDIGNFSILMAHVRVLPALWQILADPNCMVQGLIAAGHVCAITGYREYHGLAEAFRVPIVITGFEPVDLMRGIYQCVAQLEHGTSQVRNAYERVVQESGNDRALALCHTYFDPCDSEWRGFGVIPQGGFAIKPAFRHRDACVRFGIEPRGAEARIRSEEASLPEVPTSGLRCYGGEILKGRMEPTDCPYFNHPCCPETPLGAPMVSSEGACAAYYLHTRWKRSEKSYAEC